MATKEEIARLKEKIQLQLQSQELDKATKELYEAMFDAAGESATKLKKVNEEIGKEIRRQASDLDYLAQSFKDSVDELTKGNSLLKDQRRSLNNLTKVARDLLDVRTGEVSVNQKALDKKKELIKQEQRNLEATARLLKAKGEDTAAIQDQIKQTKELLAGYHKIQDTVDKTNKSLGAIPLLAGGIDKALQKAGIPALGLADALERTHMAAQEAAEAGEDFSAFANFTGNVKDNIMDALTPANLMQFALVELVDAVTSVDKQAGEFAKNFGISYEAALGLKSELTSAANQSYLLNINSQGLVEAFTKINNLFGTFGQVSEQVLEDFSRLTGEASLSEEAVSALYKTTLLTGKELEGSTKEFAGQAQALAMSNGLALNQKQILEAVKDISTATLLQLQGQPEALAEAVVAAKQLGISLEAVENISSSLLQFESSIQNELEAELLTGKQLNLEKARLAALNGDIATVAEEIAKQTGSAADFAKMNVIQQEALAKSVGMTRDSLAESLLEREALVKLSGVEGKTAQERFNNLVKEVGMEEAKKRLGDEQLANLYSQQNVQERFAAAVEKLKDVFVGLAEPILKIVSPFVDLVTTLLPAVNLLLSPIIAGVNVMAEGFEYIVNSVKSLIGVLTGSNEQLTVMQGIVGGIASIYLAIKGYALGTKVLQGASLAIEAARGGFAKKRLLLESAGLTKQVGTAIFSVISSFSKIPFGVGVGLGIAAAAGIASMAAKYMKADDLMSPGTGSSGYGNRTLLAPEGAFALNNKDTIIAGTNLTPPPSTSQATANAEQRKTNSLLERLLTKDQNVYMDSDKVGTSFAKSASF